MGRGKATLGMMDEMKTVTRDDIPKHCGKIDVNMEERMGVKAFESSGGDDKYPRPKRDFERGGAFKFEDGDMEVKAVDWKTLAVGTGLGVGGGLISGDIANRVQEARIDRREKKRQQAAVSAEKDWNYMNDQGERE
jgi:hypothetical protein